VLTVIVSALVPAATPVKVTLASVEVPVSPLAAAPAIRTVPVLPEVETLHWLAPLEMVVAEQLPVVVLTTAVL
jgi:hypothetical protein